ncbi:helix-turn-helix domain-containing protein [Algirhabdus cladophorae]|uniref:helix-turn-helix domain-containing protein n=1 Tax=Algirhabdus cladophorae TaxID=3377108 RepID=UPI003B84ADA5
MTQKDEPGVLKLARGPNDDETAVPLNLGQRVRDLRKSHNWTLEQAAQQAGLARSTLSKIENGQMSPTYEALKKLAEGLQISVPQLFTPPIKGQVNGRMAVTKRGEGAEYATATYEHKLLAASMTKKQMLPYRAQIRARSMDEFDGWVRHDGEEFMYVLTGTVILYTEFYEPVEMSRGDSAYYDGSMGHNVISTSPEDALILWVTTQI